MITVLYAVALIVTGVGLFAYCVNTATDPFWSPGLRIASLLATFLAGFVVLVGVAMLFVAWLS